MFTEGKNNDCAVTFRKLQDFKCMFGYSVLLANKAIQDHLLEVEESKDQMKKEMLEKIGKLEKELENANDLLSATKRKGMN